MARLQLRSSEVTLYPLAARLNLIKDRIWREFYALYFLRF